METLPVFQTKDSLYGFDMFLRRRIAAQCLEFRNRTMQNFVEKALGQAVNGCFLIPCERSQTILAFGQFLLPNRFPMVSQRNDSWSHVHGFGRIEERLYFLANDFFGKLGFTLTLFQVGIDDITKIIDVVQEDVANFVDLWFDVARNSNINNKHGPIFTELDQT